MASASHENVDLIVVGGGIFGSSIAYYFKRDNPYKEVVVYEQNELCSGSTSVAAALMSRVRPYGHVIPLSLETYRVIPELEKITGDPLPVHYNGAIHIAVNERNIAQLEKMIKTASSYGIDWKNLTSQEAEGMLPWLKAPAAGKIVLVPGEAITDPYLLGMAFVNASKAIGVKYIRNTKVIEILNNNNVITGIKSKDGVHYSDKTVLADAGQPNPFDFSHYTPDRFGIFNPFSIEHLSRCAAARSNKTSG